MTEELFREDATLLQCEATVVGHGEGGVLLDRTSCSQRVLHDSAPTHTACISYTGFSWL